MAERNLLAKRVPARVPASDVALDELSRRERNKLRTREAILVAARRCFTRGGVTATTMDEIAERAEVARGTLFNYFASKAEVVAALMTEKADAFEAIVLHASKSDAPIAARIATVFIESAEGLAKTSRLSRTLLDPGEQGWSTAAGGGAVIGRLIAAFTRLLETAPDAAALRTDVPPGHLGELLLGIYSGIVHLWRVDETYPIAARFEQAARLAAEMVLRR